MNRYTIYCTAEQTKKALELRAPIINYPIQMSPYGVPKYERQLPSGKWIAYMIPTAEQIIGWLNEQGIMAVVRTNYDDYAWEIWEGSFILDMSETETLSSRKEATLAAIDAALEYLKITMNNYGRKIT